MSGFSVTTNNNLLFYFASGYAHYIKRYIKIYKTNALIDNILIWLGLINSSSDYDSNCFIHKFKINSYKYY